ncbi:MAG: acetyl-CoA carboxylase biotin carboxylase subunit [Myxococcales bacterium]|nr:acetyl-CoA carboxylase biotin carboxylase subunit [Myxococcales bacterium]
MRRPATPTAPASLASSRTAGSPASARSTPPPRRSAPVSIPNPSASAARAESVSKSNSPPPALSAKEPPPLPPSLTRPDFEGGAVFPRVLVANRGEIAVRIMRTLRDLGISPVAVHSESDRHALHVRSADVSVCVGPEPSRESYLRGDAIIEAAKRTGATAIHPGYGFLSENAAFAQSVIDADLTWIGPPPSAIVSMGDKLLARRTVMAAGVPIVPGTEDPVTDVDAAMKLAIEIGFPVMVKASAGGGGKGMRKVDSAKALRAAIETARREAKGAFGDDSVYLEKFVVGPHHVEIQVFADAHGGCVYLGERECSVQRRHQKVIEECPSPFIDEVLRRRMGEVAVAAARACNYVGAGTCEFLVGADRNFYFLEMNTRLQVEHPVTELVYGVDLVEWQLRVAAGERLPLTQAELVPRGHALECRIYAEDSETFLPCPGAISHCTFPQGPGVRVDAGIDGGSIVPMAYDPLLAKLCTWGSDRAQAIRRMGRALDETVILGITTNTALHRRVLAHDDFVKGLYDTHLLESPLPPLQTATEAQARDAATAVALERFLADEARPAVGAATSSSSASLWQVHGRGRVLRGG